MQAQRQEIPVLEFFRKLLWSGGLELVDDGDCDDENKDGKTYSQQYPTAIERDLLVSCMQI